MLARRRDDMLPSQTPAMIESLFLPFVFPMLTQIHHEGRSTPSPENLPPQRIQRIRILCPQRLAPQQLQQLINIIRILITAKQARVTADTLLVPLAQHINDVSRQDLLSNSSERSNIVVPHALDVGDNGFKGEANRDEKVLNPGAWADVVLVFDGVLLDHRNKEGGRECGFGEGEAVCHVTHHVNDASYGCWVPLLLRAF